MNPTKPSFDMTILNSYRDECPCQRIVRLHCRRRRQVHCHTNQQHPKLPTTKMKPMKVRPISTVCLVCERFCPLTGPGTAGSMHVSISLCSSPTCCSNTPNCKTVPSNLHGVGHPPFRRSNSWGAGDTRALEKLSLVSNQLSGGWSLFLVFLA